MIEGNSVRDTDLPNRINPHIKETLCFGLTGLIITGVFYCITIVPMHELGHAAVCMDGGHSPVLIFDGRVGIKCDGIGAPFWPYHVMGGVFGMVGASVLYGIGRLIRAPHMLLAAVTLAVEEACVTIVETVFHVQYIEDPLTPLLYTVPTVYVGLMLVMHRQSNRVARLMLLAE